MTEQNTPSVSIIIVCWNSAAFLPRCIQSLIDQTYRDFEVIVIDNASTDDGTVELAARYPTLALRVERLDHNLGFASANNVGARLARGSWLALLNPDAFPQPDWLEQLVNAAASHPNSFFASRQIQANNPQLLDGEGDSYHISGLAWRAGYDSLVAPPGDVHEVFSACAAAAMLSRREFLEAGGFDEDYFAYQEDVDLGFRLRLRGLKCFVVPRAIVHHVGSARGGKLSSFVIYHAHRNLVWTYLKDVPSPLVWLYLPAHIALNLYFLLSFSMQGKAQIIFQAKAHALRDIWTVLAKRRVIQAQRRVPLSQVFRAMHWSRGSPPPAHMAPQSP